MLNELQLLHEWSRRIGGDPRHGHNELQLLRQIARARGHATTHTMNEVAALRAIAASYGKSNVGYMNELDALRAIVDGMGAKPSNRNLHDMNEIDCLWAIIRASGAAPAQPAFSPSDVPFLLQWLKADALVLADNDAVASWTDSSGLGNHAVQATEAAKPTYKTGILNGKPVVRFDAVDDIMSKAIAQASPYTVIVCGSMRGANAAFISGPFFYTDAGAALSLFIAAGVTGTYTVVNGTVFIGVAVFNGASSAIFVNGAAAGTGDPGAAALAMVTIGASSGRVLGGDIAELLIYGSALSATDRDAIETYLGAKYGIAVV